MIPQRRLSREGYGNGVSCRVEACRRRLRILRANGLQVRFDNGRATEFAAEIADLNGVSFGNLEFGANESESQDEVGIT
jgi:hypothetical protein